MEDLEKLITKELLRKVLPKETKNLSDDFSFYLEEDYIVFCDKGEQLFEYCIYEFAFIKCKDLGLSKGYSLRSDCEGCLLVSRKSFMGSDEEWFNGTEVESIIKACNWILEQEVLK